jgi:hypothetical protein
VKSQLEQGSVAQIELAQSDVDGEPLGLHRFLNVTLQLKVMPIYAEVNLELILSGPTGGLQLAPTE